MPGKLSVAWTVYNLGWSGDHRPTGPNPVRLSRAVLVPGESAVTARVCAAICRGPSNSWTSRVPSECSVTAESRAHSMSTRGWNPNTSVGRANRSARNTWGSTRSRTSR